MVVKVKEEKYSNGKKFYRRTGINLKDRLLKYRHCFYMRDKNYCLDEKNQKGKNITANTQKNSKVVMIAGRC